MKKICGLLFTILGLCAFSELEGTNEPSLDVKSNNTAWEVEMKGTSTVRAYNADTEFEVIINVAELLPNSPRCSFSKRAQKIKLPVDVRKIAQQGDSGWLKSVQKTKFYFSGAIGNAERRASESTLIKNNAKFTPGELVNLGTLFFWVTVPCRDITSSTIRISDMEIRGRTLPPIDFTFIPAGDKKD